VIRLLTAVLISTFILTAMGSESIDAQGVPKPQRPLVFIPGIIGSELWSGDERLWGGLGDLVHLDRLAISGGPRDVDPLQTCSHADSQDKEKRQICGPIEAFSTLPPFAMDQYESFFKLLEQLGYKRSGSGRNLYVFAYDWRRSNFQTADDFKKFVDHEDGLAGKEFDILGHSMGGLVGFIYVRKYDAPPDGASCTPGLCRVQTFVTLGTPFWGSLSTIATIDAGWGQPVNWIAGGLATIRKTVLSWPSIYEMLPTDDDCCAIETAPKLTTKLDLLQYDAFSKLPFANEEGAPLANAIKAALARATDLKKLVRSGFPPYLENRPGPCDTTGRRIFAITGDHYDTSGALMVRNGKLQIEPRRGDDTVVVRSSNRGFVAQAFVSFTRHRQLFADDHVTDNIHNILLRCELSLQNYGAPNLSIKLQRATGGSPIIAPVHSVAVEVKPELLRVGTNAKLSFKLDLETDADVVPPRGTFAVTISGKQVFAGSLSNGNKLPPTDGGRVAFQFNAQEIPITDPGLAIIVAQFPDIGSIQTEALVIPAQ
jgi:pimeloyl-ACP methyl ester carboxylesterase